MHLRRETCRLFEKSAENTDALAISEAAIRVLAAAEDKTKVLEIFIERLQPRSWSGNLSAVLRERLPLLRSLNPNDDPALQEKIVSAEMVFADWIAREEKREEAEEKGRSESFE